MSASALSNMDCMHAVMRKPAQFISLLSQIMATLFLVKKDRTLKKYISNMFVNKLHIH